MTTEPTRIPPTPPRDPRGTPIATPPAAVPPRLPAGTVLMAGVLLLIPIVALAIVPVYARTTPKLWGFPFFYWYQFAWVLITAVLTYLAYVVVTRARRTGRSR